MWDLRINCGHASLNHQAYVPGSYEMHEVLGASHGCLVSSKHRLRITRKMNKLKIHPMALWQLCDVAMVIRQPHKISKSFDGRFCMAAARPM